MGGKAGTGRKRIRRWVTRDRQQSPGDRHSSYPSPYVNVYSGSPKLHRRQDGAGVSWLASTSHTVVCHREIEELLGTDVPTDRPILVEFTARVVPDE